MQEKRKNTTKRGKVIRFYNNEFYAAVMDEDLEAIECMSKKYGSDFLIRIQSGGSGGVFWKDFAVLPLHLAASSRRAQSLQSLLLAGADTEMKDQLGQTALHLMIINWPTICSKSLKSDSKHRTAVIGACRQAETCLRLLCKHGADINAKVKGKGDQNALHLSVQYRVLSAVHILTSFGADVNAVDSSAMTPLHMSAGVLHKDMTASLIRQGADINMRMQHSGNTPLHLAVVAMATKTSKTQKADIRCICELLEQGAKPDLMNTAGMSPLHLACTMGKEELVDLLLSYGANVNQLSRAGETCLFLFLNHINNVKNRTLLMKLLSLTSPLTVFNQNGCLPSTLTQPCFFKQRDQLIELMQQPRTLLDICKSAIYLKYVGGKKDELKTALPGSLYDFVFDHWAIRCASFVDDCEPDFVK